MKVFLLMIICAIPSCAALSLSVSLYNSDDSLSVNLFGDGFEFDAMSVLMPDSLFYSNGGSSTADNCFYSYEAVLNGERVGSAAGTNSGGFGFSTVVDANYNGDGSREFKHSASSRVTDGDLWSSAFNSDCRIEEDIHTKSAAYSQKAMIRPDFLQSSGKGATAGNSNDLEAKSTSAASEASRGVWGSITINGPGAVTSIDQNVVGDTEFLWVDSFSSDSDGYSIFRGARGVILTEVSLGMIGESTGFPTQVLPPGGISVIKHEYDPWSDNLDRYEVLSRFGAEINEFMNLYPDTIFTPAMWYYLDQKGCLMPVDDGDSADTSANPSGYFKMSMQFDVEV